MTPILVRPIREQLEHDRVIRLLQLRLRRRFGVGINIGDEPEATGVRSGTEKVYPDLVLTSAAGARRLHGVVEVETAESVNRLEAMHEWAHFGKVRGAFYLYVPSGATDVARRLCEQFRVSVNEIWSYHAVGDQIRFTMVHRSKRSARSAGSTSSRTVRRPRQGAQGSSKTTKTGRKAKAVTAKRKAKAVTAKRRASKKAKASDSGGKKGKFGDAGALKKASAARSKKRGGTAAGATAKRGVDSRRAAKKTVTKKSGAETNRKSASRKTVKTRSRKRR